MSAETESPVTILSKSPQKRPLWSRRRNARFGKTGWWRKQSSETGLQFKNRELFEIHLPKQDLGALCTSVDENSGCMDWRHMDSVSTVGHTVYGELLNLCMWNKSNAGMGSLYRSKHELVFVYRVGSAPHLNMVELGKHGRNRTNVWDYASVNSLRGSRREDLALHPTVKPTGLVADAIQDVTRRGDLVLDLFLGSGTTLMAADRIGRRFRGLDIDPCYVDVAIERWAARTGLEPRLGGPPS